MSKTFSIARQSSILSEQFYPPLVLDEKSDYSLGLINFEVYNSIPNVDGTNNLFHYDIDDKVIEIPVGAYEIEDINRFIQNYLIASHVTDVYISITANKNTLRGEIKSNKRINFKLANSIGSLLGFKPRELKPLVRHISDFPVRIQKVNTIRLECNLVTGSYINNQPGHILHEFFPTVAPGYKISERPSNVIYLPVTKKQIDNITVRIVDQDGNLVNFVTEEVTIRLHLKKYGA